MKLSSSKIICLGLLISLFASCNKGSKFASSFNKRRYTKGHYFDWVEHKKQQLPAIAANKISERNTKLITNKTATTDTDLTAAIPSTSIVLGTNPKKEQTLGINNSFKNGSCYAPVPIADGVPGHDNSTNVSSSKHDGEVQAGLGLSILSILLTFVGGLGLILLIPAMIFSIMGLKSKRYHAMAVVGLVFCIVEIVAILLVIAVILSLSGTMSFI